MSEYGPGNITALFGGQPFDPNAHEPSKDFEVLPPGKYTCLIEDAELKDTKAGTGKLIKVVLSVIEGKFKGQKLPTYINLQNPSKDCQRIGISQLSSLGRAAQCYPVNDTADLVDKVVVAVVKVEKRKDTGEDQNEVRTYESPASVAPVQHIPATPGRTDPPAPLPQNVAPATAAVGPQPAAAPPTSTPATGNAPWKR